MRASRISIGIAWCALALAACAARAAPAGDAALHEAAASLRPGQYVWADSTSADAPVAIQISLALQRLYVYRGGALVGVSTVSTGRPGKETPLGTFEILQKARWHRSNLYSNAPMPFMQRLTWDGIAIHAGDNPGYPASHGCVRLPAAFASALFAMTSLGASVTVADYPLAPPVWLEPEDLELLFADDRVTGGGPAGRAPIRLVPIRLAYAASVFAAE